MPMRLLWVLLGLAVLPVRAETVYSFGAVPVRSPVLTAQYWNPILNYVSQKAGVTLLLKVARTGTESTAAITRGEYDFAWTNHIFKPTTASVGYQVILRPRTEALTSQIVTLEGSTIRRLADLQGQTVGFPSKAAFVGYAVPMDHLIRQGITVSPMFGGNQEGIMGQLKAGKVAAAAVNNLVMRGFAAREGLRYSVIWESQPYHDVPIAAHPRVPRAVVMAVQKAFADMGKDPEGIRVQEASAQIIGEKPPYGFQPASQKEFQNYMYLYRHSVVKDLE
ncbi:MAG: phosphate/phosphite/phosphonate ABC transporter substrate-binding protein [Hydrogenophilales bacterium]|nr:phosphate/phosphite/phosphonate ABC transporter substrate-binding protein [Hydrogenophilales bacterium]